jgi:hypothetical protein
MKSISIIFAIIAFITGIRASWLWYKSSKVKFEPMGLQFGQLQPLNINESQLHWIIAILQTLEKSGDLNRKATIWSAASIAASALGTFISIF